MLKWMVKRLKPPSVYSTETKNNYFPTSLNITLHPREANSTLECCDPTLIPQWLPSSIAAITTFLTHREGLSIAMPKHAVTCCCVFIQYIFISEAFKLGSRTLGRCAVRKKWEERKQLEALRGMLEWCWQRRWTLTFYWFVWRHCPAHRPLWSIDGARLVHQKPQPRTHQHHSWWNSLTVLMSPACEWAVVQWISLGKYQSLSHVCQGAWRCEREKSKKLREQWRCLHWIIIIDN